MAEAITGFWTAVASPVGADGALAGARFVQHALDQFEHGVDGIVVFGTSGEGPSFSAAERLEGVEALLRAGVAPHRVGLGCGFPALEDSADLARQALALGLTHILLLPPYFFRDATAAGIEDAFASILDRVNDDRVRATLYHIPQVSGVAVPPEAAAHLRERYGRLVAGIKDSSGDFSHFLAFRAAAPDLAVTVGNEADIGRAVAAGGAGTICGLANIAPALVRAIFADPAAEKPLAALVAQFSGRPFVPTLKAVIAAQTGDASWLHVRPALRAVSLADGQRIAAWLESLGRPEAA